MAEVVISLTTMPCRIQHIEPCIDSLLLQKLPVCIWIPRKVARTGEVFDGRIPDFLVHDRIRTEIVPDYGPITKLLPALDAGHDIIITADDDVVYCPGWAQGLIDALDERDACIGYRGRIFQRGGYNVSSLVIDPPAPQRVTLITGTWGRICRSSFFHKSIFQEWKQCKSNDDITIDAHLRKRRIDRLVIQRPCNIKPYRVHEINPLWKINKARNDRLLERVFW